MAKNTKGSLRTPENDSLIQTIRTERQNRGISQRELSRRLGFDDVIYGRTERGVRIVDVVEFVKIADAIGIDPLQLLANYLVALRRLPVTKD